MSDQRVERDDLDGCQAVQDSPDVDDDDTAELRALFPDGVADDTKADEWRQLFVGEIPGDLPDRPVRRKARRMPDV